MKKFATIEIVDLGSEDMDYGNIKPEWLGKFVLSSSGSLINFINGTPTAPMTWGMPIEFLSRILNDQLPEKPQVVGQGNHPLETMLTKHEMMLALGDFKITQILEIDKQLGKRNERIQE